MNYQPFFEMNFLISDSMIQVLQENKLNIIIAAFTTFYLLMILNLIIFALIVRFISIFRHRPISVSNGSAKDLI